jgi:hypothetical protein
VIAQLKDENIMLKEINLKMSLQAESAKDNEETLKKENQASLIDGVEKLKPRLKILNLLDHAT